MFNIASIYKLFLNKLESSLEATIPKLLLQIRLISLELLYSECDKYFNFHLSQCVLSLQNSTLAFSIISVVSARHYPNWYKCLAPLQAKIKVRNDYDIIFLELIGCIIYAVMQTSAELAASLLTL